MLNVVFKRDLKKLKSSNRDEDEQLAVLEVLAMEQPLGAKFQDHALTGDYTGCRECHICPDWLYHFTK